jgi:hypothetical protein
VLLALGAVKIGAHKPDEAQKIAEEIMALQPEGRVNAEARLLAGEVQWSAEILTTRAKPSKGVALLYDDPAITPRALTKQHWRIGRRVILRKQIACRASYTSDIRITPAG